MSTIPCLSEIEACPLSAPCWVKIDYDDGKATLFQLVIYCPLPYIEGGARGDA